MDRGVAGLSPAHGHSLLAHHLKSLSEARCGVQVVSVSDPDETPRLRARRPRVMNRPRLRPERCAHRLCRVRSLVVQVDHVIYGTTDLDVAAAQIEACLGLTAVAGGRHEGLGTHNRIVALGDGSFIELLAIADPEEAHRSPIGAAVQTAIARGQGLFGWAVAVEDVGPIAQRLGTTITTVRRQGMTARLAGVQESLSDPALPFFIERPAGRIAGRAAPPVANAAASFSWLEVAVDAQRLERWLGGDDLPVRVVDGDGGLRAIGIGDRELRAA